MFGIDIEVILDVYSGQENPTWKLDSDDVDYLRKKALDKDTQVKLSGAPEPPQLGYRGFQITIDLPWKSEPIQMRVYDGTITSVIGDSTRYFKDTANLEEWLQAQARDKGFGETLDKLLG